MPTYVWVKKLKAAQCLNKIPSYKTENVLYIYLSIIFNALIYLAMRFLPILSGPFLAIFLIIFFDLDPQNPSVTYTLAIIFIGQFILGIELSEFPDWAK